MINLSIIYPSIYETLIYHLPFIHPSIHYLSIHLFIHPNSVHLSIHPSINPSNYLSIIQLELDAHTKQQPWLGAPPDGGLIT